MAYVPATLSVSLACAIFLLLNKLMTIIVVHHVLGLPDYVIGEMLSSSSGEMRGDRGSRAVHGSHPASHLVHFSPPFLDLREHPIGIPIMERVTISNLHQTKPVALNSISGTSDHFHCSFFEDKRLAPLSNTTFKVVFLAREKGAVSSTLRIHTSLGSFNYTVQGTGIDNGFRLKPIVGAKIPLNTSFSQIITIYNPLSESLQVTEMYSSGGGLHLELPHDPDSVASGVRIGDHMTFSIDRSSLPNSNLWLIQPYESKAVVKAFFLPTTESKHTAFIRIKTNTSTTFILPVEVQVVSPDTMASEGAFMQPPLRIGKDPPSLSSILTFELAEKPLVKKCRKQMVTSEFTITKSFQLINEGQDGVRITGFLIGPHLGVSSTSYTSKSTLESLLDQPVGSNCMLAKVVGTNFCTGFGFHVNNCDNLTQDSHQSTPKASSSSSPSLSSHSGSSPSDSEGSTIALGVDGPVSFVPIFLDPNQSVLINISFTPDFTVTKTMATLTVLTDASPPMTVLHQHWFKVLTSSIISSMVPASWSFPWMPEPLPSAASLYMKGVDMAPTLSPIPGSITYSLVATVPKSLLAKCDQSLPRPYQEAVLYFTLVVIMICSVMVTMAFSFIHGTRVLNFTFYPAVMMSKAAGSGPDSIPPNDFKPFTFKLMEGETGNGVSKGTSLINGSNECTYKKKLSTTSSDSSGTIGGRGLGGKNTVPEMGSVSWSSFLKNSLSSTRRGSNVSINSKDSADGLKGTTTKRDKKGKKNRLPVSSNPTLETVLSGDVTNTQSPTPAVMKVKAPKTRSWFESIVTRKSEKDHSPPPPLPSFESAFDDDDINNMLCRKKKWDKKTVAAAPTTATAPVPTPAMPVGSVNMKEVNVKHVNGSPPLAIVLPIPCFNPSYTESSTKLEAKSNREGDGGGSDGNVMLKPFISPNECKVDKKGPKVNGIMTSPTISPVSTATVPTFSPSAASLSSPSSGVRNEKRSPSPSNRSTFGSHPLTSSIPPFCHQPTGDSIPGDAFDPMDFGHWPSSFTSGPGTNGSKESSGQSDDSQGKLGVWDSPITMFDSKKALKELRKNPKQLQKNSSSSLNQSSPLKGKNSNGVNTNIGTFGPPPGFSGKPSSVRPSAMSSATAAVIPSMVGRSTFPPVGTFDPDAIGVLPSNPPSNAPLAGTGSSSSSTSSSSTANQRQISTPSPRGWSPSHKGSNNTVSTSIESGLNQVLRPSVVSVSSGWSDMSSGINSSHASTGSAASHHLVRPNDLTYLRDGSVNWDTNSTQGLYRTGYVGPVHRPNNAHHNSIGSSSSSNSNGGSATWSSGPIGHNNSTSSSGSTSAFWSDGPSGGTASMSIGSDMWTDSAPSSAGISSNGSVSDVWSDKSWNPITGSTTWAPIGGSIWNFSDPSTGPNDSSKP